MLHFPPSNTKAARSGGSSGPSYSLAVEHPAASDVSTSRRPTADIAPATPRALVRSPGCTCLEFIDTSIGRPGRRLESGAPRFHGILDRPRIAPAFSPASAARHSRASRSASRGRLGARPKMSWVALLVTDRLPIRDRCGVLQELHQHLDELLRWRHFRLLDRVLVVLELQEVELRVGLAHARGEQPEAAEVRDDLREHHL